MFNDQLGDMSKEEAKIRLDEHDLYCEVCMLIDGTANNVRCLRGAALIKIVSNGQ